MKWITHQIGAGLCATVLGMSLAATGLAIAGAIIPDIIDQQISSLANKNNRQKVFNQIHRGSSHWFGWWLLLFLLISASPVSCLFKELMCGLALGALSHVGFDMLTPKGIPLLPLKSSLTLSLPLCATGKAGEYIFIGSLVMAAFIFSYEEIAAVYYKLFSH